MTLLSAERRTSHSMPAPKLSAARNAARLFSGTPEPWSPRCANPIGPGSSRLGFDLNDRIHLDRNAEWQDRNADGRASVAADFTEHVLHQLRSAVGNLG